MKTAIVLFNLGGPDKPEAVQPFLFNLFSDPAIVRLPKFLRQFIARKISKGREHKAQEIYKKIGGHSPILRNTQLQANALEAVLNRQEANIYKCFVSMRYWHPFVDEVMEDVQEFRPDEIVLVPLYPQFSTTTSASSLKSWHDTMKQPELSLPTYTVCCYPQQKGFINSLSDLVRSSYHVACDYGRPKVLFSAHGLPEKIVKAGDPYPWQCHQTVQSILREINIPELDHVLCYQSRIGPLKWIGPETREEIRQVASEKRPVVIAPIAFVSEHSETLVEIDIEYRRLAEEWGSPYFAYTGTVDVAPRFIEGLADMVRSVRTNKSNCVSETGERLCPKQMTGCACV